MIAIILVLLSLVILFFSRQLGYLFTTEVKILDIFESINIPFANMMIWMNLAVANDTILGAMGRSSLVFKLGLIGSWIGQVPGVLVAVYLKKDIVSLYYGVSFGYFLLCLFQLYFIINSDWDLYTKEAQERVKSQEKPLLGNEEKEGSIEIVQVKSDDK